MQMGADRYFRQSLARLSGLWRRQPARHNHTIVFPGFKAFKVKTTGAEINGVIGGQGPPVLLLHGAPKSHITWRMIGPTGRDPHGLAPDLRGYGDSGKTPDSDMHANYSKRAMALDQVDVMKHFGFDKFPVIGHDRGGRVAHRMALDHPDAVTKLRYSTSCRPTTSTRT